MIRYMRARAGKAKTQSRKRQRSDRYKIAREWDRTFKSMSKINLCSFLDFKAVLSSTNEHQSTTPFHNTQGAHFGRKMLYVAMPMVFSLATSRVASAKRDQPCVRYLSYL